MKDSFGVRIRRGGFSLIELLIVVTIIMILAGLLLPALRGARERAKTVSCIANLKDIGVALLLYEQEYNGFPSAPGTGANGWPNPLHFGLGGKKGTNSAQTTLGSDLIESSRPINRMYANQGDPKREMRSFRCLSDRGDSSTGVASMWDSFGNSYIYGGNSSNLGQDIDSMYTCNSAGTSCIGKRRASIVAPAKKIMVMEPSFLEDRSCTDQMNWRHYFRSGGNVSGAPSSPQGNVLFADGAVRYVVRDRGDAGAGCDPPNWAVNNDVPDLRHDWY